MKHFSFSNLSVLTVGDVILDKYLYGSINRISPEAPVPIFDFQSDSYTLGGASNIAANISGLGAKSYLCGTVSYNDIRILKKLFLDNSVDFRSVFRDHTSTITKTRLVSHNQHIIRVDEEKNCHYKLFSQELISEIDNLIFSNKIDLIILSDYNKGTITQEVIDFLSKVSSQKNIPIYFGPKPSNDLLFSDFKLLSLNKKEVKQLAQSKSDDLMVLCKLILDKYHPKQICITLGEDGIFFYDANTRSHQHFLTKNQFFIDVCGAGDTVLSTISLFLHSGFSISLACSAANSAASIVIKRQGTSTIGQKELEDLL